MRPILNVLPILCLVLVGLTSFITASELTEAELARLTPAQKKIVERAAEREEKYYELYEAKKYAESVPLVEKIIADYEAVIGKEHPLTAEWVHELGTLHAELENHREAKLAFERALAVQRRRLGDEHDETMQTLQNLADHQLTVGEYAAARKSLDEVLRVRLKVHGDKAELTADTLNYLGMWADKTDDFAAACDYYRRSRKIYTDLHGAEHEGAVLALGNLALAEWSAGNYLSARDLQEEALAIRRKTLGNEHFDVAMSLNNLGLVERDLGDYELARKHIEEALRIAAATIGEKHANFALFLGNLSTVLIAQEDLQGALAAAEKALAVQEKVYGPEHDETLVPLNTLFEVKLLAKDYVGAEAYLARVKRVAIAAFGENSTTALAVLKQEAILHYVQGRTADSAPLYRRIYEGFRDRFGEDQFDTALARGDWALLQAIGGDPLAALADMDAARRNVRRIAFQILPGLPDRQVLQCLEQSDKEFQHTALSLGLRFREDPAWRERSAAWLINGKAVAQEVLAQQALLAREASDPAIADTVRELLSVRRRLAALSVITPGKEDSADHERVIEELETQDRGLMKKIAAHERAKNAAAPDDKGRWKELADIRAKLPADAMFVNFARLKPINFKPTSYDDRFESDRYVAWLIPAAGDVQIVDLGPAADIDALIKTLREAITASVAGGAVAKQGEAAAAEKTVEPFRALSQRILQPLLPHFGDKTALILSPDSRLWLAPWQALPLANGSFAIEKYRFRFLLSGRELLMTFDPPKRAKGLIFADPDYNLIPKDAEGWLKDTLRDEYQPPDTTGVKIRSVEAANKLQASRLPGTAAEAVAIQPALEVFTGVKPVLYSNQYALEGVFKKVLAPRVVVLSTHGFFYEDQTAGAGSKWNTTGAAFAQSGKPLENPLLRCGLLLAGCNQPRNDGGDDGVLTGLEILGADLRGTELVVLSACETGLGKVNDGDGVAGLRQAFQLAGARSVVASLWQVPDRDSALLMNDFFHELAAGKAKDEALRLAQIKRIQSRRDRFGAAHPFFWAAWTVTGE